MYGPELFVVSFSDNGGWPKAKRALAHGPLIATHKGRQECVEMALKNLVILSVRQSFEKPMSSCRRFNAIVRHYYFPAR